MLPFVLLFLGKRVVIRRSMLRQGAIGEVSKGSKREDTEAGNDDEKMPPMQLPNHWSYHQTSVSIWRT